MNAEDASELALYATELFRYVTDAQKTSVAELMLPIADVPDETGKTVTPALEVGKMILRAAAAQAGDEQRLHVSEIKRHVDIHQRLWGGPAPDPEKDKRAAELKAAKDAAATGDALQQWAASLTDAEEKALRAEAMKQVSSLALRLFKDKTLSTSRTLRMLAWEHHRKVHAFD